MALQVWLPLNGNLDNNGLSDIRVTNGGATVVSTGKIGKAYSFDGTSNYIQLDNMTFMPTMLQKEWTVAFWVYSNDGGARSVYFSNYQLGGAGDVSFGFEKTASDVLRIVYNAGQFDINVPQCVIDTGKWVHLAISKDVNHLVSVYKNGVLVHSFTDPDCKSNGTLYYLGRDSRADGTAFCGHMNDFRIYDRALSINQVREISKGLIAHYRLGGPGANLLPPDGLVKSGATSLTFDALTNTYTIVSPAGSGTWGHGVNIADSKNILVPYGESYRVSFEVLVPTAHTIKFDYNNISADSSVASWNGNDNDLAGSRLGSSFSIPANQWTKIVTGSKNAHASNTSQVAIKEYSKIGLYTENDTEGTTWYLRNVKFELGNQATEWTPYVGDWGYLVDESDCSGNKYHLTFSAIKPEIRGEGMRYSGSFLFHGKNTQYLYRNRFDWLKPPFTFNCWCNQASRTSEKGSAETTTLQFVESQGRDCGLAGFSLALANGVPRLYLGTETDGTYHQINSDTTLTLNTWHMLTGTYDGTTVKLYVDGVLKASKAVTTAIDWSQATGFTIGKMAYLHTTTTNYFPFNGYINDVRIYATALSEKDVLNLYQKSAYIDNKGFVGAYEFIEEE